VVLPCRNAHWHLPFTHEAAIIRAAEVGVSQGALLVKTQGSLGTNLARQNFFEAARIGNDPVVIRITLTGSPVGLACLQLRGRLELTALTKAEICCTMRLSI
jgi:hypothetical protein